MTAPASGSSTLLGVVCALAGAVLALYLVADAWGERESIEATTRNIERELEQKQQYAISHDAYRTQFAQEKARHDEMFERLPSRLDKALLEKSLRDLATRSGVQVEWQPLEKEVTREFYAQARTTVTVHGPLPSITQFLDGFVRQAPLHTVARIRIEREDANGTLRASLPTTYFRYAED
jgi:Tfp pilus assembly protein PilO